jgi:hypothetical protein
MTPSSHLKAWSLEESISTFFNYRKKRIANCEFCIWKKKHPSERKGK